MKTIIKIALAACLASLGLLTGEPASRSASAAERDHVFNALSEGKRLHGFRTIAVYLNAADKRIGARFIHERTGFTFDLLQIQSVPQTFLWVNTLPTSDKGEPHTQEHLLLGKGNQGRNVASLETMSLTGSSASTEQWRTFYHSHTTAASEVFFRMLERQMDALLHPDYTDEEIRREVRTFGVTENPDKSLRLEEKGSVYNEMVGAVDDAGYRIDRALGIALYGPHHPLFYNSGGTPEGIRQMTPEDIRTFHRLNYRLNNMGMIGAFPREMALPDILERSDAILGRLQPLAGNAEQTAPNVPRFPPPQPTDPGKFQIVEYPEKNALKPGPVTFAWPAVRTLDSKGQLLMELFLENLAGDAQTPLYETFVGGKTRVADTGASGVYAYVTSDQGFPVFVGLKNVRPEKMNPRDIVALREQVIAELRQIAGWRDGSPELAAFNAQLRARLTQARRTYSKFVNSPPGFGERWNDGSWVKHLLRLEHSGETRRSVTLKPEIAFVERLLSGKENFWRCTLAEWKLTDTVPYAAAARAKPALLEQNEQERAERIAVEVARLKKQYKVTDEQEAIRLYRTAYDATTAEMESAARRDPPVRFVDAPPLTLDDSLDFKVSTLPGGVPLVASTFDSMTGATTGLALRLNEVSEEELLYLALLPELLTEAGVIEKEKPISYEQMLGQQRREILSLSASYNTKPRTGRYELILRGAGNDAKEARQAVTWMERVLQHPDWRPGNLPRLRDLVDQALSALRNKRQGYEETWVNGVSEAWQWQDRPIYLATSSFLTRTYAVQRLRWLFKEAGSSADREAITRFLKRLESAAQEAKHTELKTLLSAMEGDQTAASGGVSERLKPLLEAFRTLPAGAKSLAAEAAKDLEQTVDDLPEESLSGDWAALCAQMLQDLLVPPAKALSDLNALRQRLLRFGNARLFVIGSGPTQASLRTPIRNLLARLDTAPVQPITYAPRPRIIERLRQRQPQTSEPIYVGLVNPATQGGVFMNSAPGVSYQETDDESLLRHLGFNLLGGGGAQSIFMKTWAAGLAYGNGLGTSPENGRISYYADKTPELPQTLRFVIDQIQHAPRDAVPTEYAIAQTFHSRSAGGYERRGEEMANNLADGTTPDLVRGFRRALLDLRKRPDLADALYGRMTKEYARVLPGLGVKGADVPGAVYFVIGPEKQFALYEAYLKSVEGARTRLHPLYARDYWMVPAKMP
ncbi:MAG: hypothetical protein EXS36_17005 [Pedosphaera sp.]|nr:hypothetical protein [Pedosphaera sp.]